MDIYCGRRDRHGITSTGGFSDPAISAKLVGEWRVLADLFSALGPRQHATPAAQRFRSGFVHGDYLTALVDHALGHL